VALTAIGFNSELYEKDALGTWDPFQNFLKNRGKQIKPVQRWPFKD
jgi:hypothetical protein